MMKSNTILIGAAVGVVGFAIWSRLASGQPVPPSKPSLRRDRNQAIVRAARRLNSAAGILAFSVFADSATEHYRGSFKNRAMFLPLLVSVASLGVSAHGTGDSQPKSHRTRNSVYVLTAATGLIGTAFHFYNVGKRVGGFCWQNLFYGAPLGAPMAILFSGLLGFCSERARDNAPESSILKIPAGRAIAAVTSAGLLGTTAEAALLHFRGAFQDPFMMLPVTLPPIGALLMARVGVGRSHSNLWLTRIWMRLLAVMGFAGAGFHAFGVSRNMGGWRNWSQNLLNGPPLPAPPSFSGLALAGLAALSLMDEHPDA
jgi:hypothetical protein